MRSIWTAPSDKSKQNKKLFISFRPDLLQLAFNSSGLPSSPSSKGSGGGPTLSSPPLDHAFLTNQTKSIFRTHLESYINIESKFLNAKCAGCLQRYYEGLGHQKVRHNNLIGGAAASGLQDLKRNTLNYMAGAVTITAFWLVMH